MSDQRKIQATCLAVTKKGKHHRTVHYHLSVTLLSHTKEQDHNEAANIPITS